MIRNRIDINQHFGVSDYVVSSGEIEKSLMTYRETGKIDNNLLSAPYMLLECHGIKDGTTTMQVPFVMAFHCRDGGKDVDVVVRDDSQDYFDALNPQDQAKIESVYSGSAHDLGWFPLKSLYRNREKAIRDSHLCKDEPNVQDHDLSEKDTFF